MKICVFLQGTVIQHQKASGLRREDVIRQVQDAEDSIRDFKNYIPIGGAVQKLKNWAAQGTEFCYISALTQNKKGRGDELVGEKGLQADVEVLKRHGFPTGQVYHRGADEEYKDVVARISPMPNVLIEDDCQSIGGVRQTIGYQLSPKIASRLKVITVKEFGGIDHFSDDVEDLEAASSQDLRLRVKQARLGLHEDETVTLSELIDS